MRRFYHEKSFEWIKPAVSFLIATTLILFFFSAFSEVSDETYLAQEKTLRQAVSSGIAHCYASEGRYPESLAYLVDNYNIYYDDEIFFIDYQILGENLFPDVTIIRKQEP